MTPTNDWQPELFREFEPPTRPRWWTRYWRPTQRFLVLRLAYEDLILGAIGALMVVVLGFCLGVERGRHLTTARLEPEASAASAAPPAAIAPWPAPVVTPSWPASPVRSSAPSLAAQPAARTKLAAAPAAGGHYVVQVASFADRATASAALTRLAQRGVRGALVTKGRYQVVYAGGFATYAQATEAAGQLRPLYRDCFIKKLIADPRG